MAGGTIAPVCCRHRVQAMRQGQAVVAVGSVRGIAHCQPPSLAGDGALDGGLGVANGADLALLLGHGEPAPGLARPRRSAVAVTETGRVIGPAAKRPAPVDRVAANASDLRLPGDRDLALVRHVIVAHRPILLIATRAGRRISPGRWDRLHGRLGYRPDYQSHQPQGQ